MSYHTNGTGRPPPPGFGRRVRNPLSLSGLALLLVGLAFAVRTYVVLVKVENQIGERSSFITRILPGFIANPAKFLSAVNGTSPGTPTPVDPLLEQRHLDLKEELDRWMAVVSFGGALMMFGIAAPTGVAIRGKDAPPRSSVAADIAPVLLIVSLTYAMLSFFEIS